MAPPSLQPEPLPHLGRRVLRRPSSADAAPDDELPSSVAELAAAGRPLAYLTFGTVFNVNPVFAAALRGLAALDLDVFVTVGPTGDPDAFGPLPPNVHVDRYVPQSLLLPHVDLVVSHAGSGTFLTALGHGLPQLCLLQAADQFDNAEACERAGAGLVLRGDGVTADAVGAAARRLTTEPRFRERARDIAREIAAMPAAGEVVPVLEHLAASR